MAGLVLSRLGHITTSPGEVVTIRGFTADVVEIAGRAITRIRLRRTDPDCGGSDEPEQAQR